MSCFLSACSGLRYTDSDYTLRTFFQLEDNLFLWGLEPVDYIFFGGGSWIFSVSSGFSVCCPP